MPAQASVVPSVRWTSVVLSLIPPLACVIVAHAALGPGNDPIVVGLFAYLFFRLVVVRRIICRDHRSGVALTRSGKFPEAIAAFQRSEKFWERHPTLDRYRPLLLANIVEPLEKKPWGLRQFAVDDLDGNRFYFHHD